MKIGSGKMVTYRGLWGNGTNEHPAMITRDWSGGSSDPVDGPLCVNLVIFQDMGPVLNMSSVMMYDCRAAADAANINQCCFWPDPYDYHRNDQTRRQ